MTDQRDTSFLLVPAVSAGWLRRGDLDGRESECWESPVGLIHHVRRGGGEPTVVVIRRPAIGAGQP